MIAQLAQFLEEGKLSAEELLRETLRKIHAHERIIHAFLNLDEAGAHAAAARSDARRRTGKTLGPLDGIPVAIKDNILTEGVLTTAGSKMLEDFIPPYDATVVARLKAQGAIIVGKTNLDAWGHGSSTENSAFGPTKNPWDSERVAGGSSGGSAAALGAGMVPLALGTDTGGSIRTPAAFCGVVGLKPTYGRVSRYGMIAMASSLDQVGPMARSVEDAAVLLEAICGRDLLDATSVPSRPFVAQNIKISPRHFNLGLPREYFAKGLDPEIEKAIRGAVAIFEESGARVEEVDLPHTSYALPAYYIIQPAEVSSNLARYDGLRFGLSVQKKGRTVESLGELYAQNRAQGFGQEAKRRIMLGTYTLRAGYYDAYYLKAQKVRTLVSRDFARVFKKVDVLLTPATPTPPFKLGEKTGDPLQMYLSDVYTVSANLAGIPALVLPCGKTKDGLPIGMQIMGPHFAEERILALGARYEAATSWHQEEPFR